MRRFHASTPFEWLLEASRRYTRPRHCWRLSRRSRPRNYDLRHSCASLLIVEAPA